MHWLLQSTRLTITDLGNYRTDSVQLHGSTEKLSSKVFGLRAGRIHEVLVQWYDLRHPTELVSDPGETPKSTAAARPLTDSDTVASGCGGL